MKRAAHDPAGVVAEQQADPREHFARGPVGEREQQDRSGVDSVLEQRATETIVRVLPEPAPASTSIGPPGCITAARCSAFNSAS
jgi:hypothetical protein